MLCVVAATSPASKRSSRNELEKISLDNAKIEIRGFDKIFYNIYKMFFIFKTLESLLDFL